jgi:hypothetical protein
MNVPAALLSWIGVIGSLVALVAAVLRAYWFHRRQWREDVAEVHKLRAGGVISDPKRVSGTTVYTITTIGFLTGFLTLLFIQLQGGPATASTIATAGIGVAGMVIHAVAFMVIPIRRTLRGLLDALVTVSECLPNRYGKLQKPPVSPAEIPKSQGEGASNRRSGAPKKKALDEAPGGASNGEGHQ